MAVMERLQEIEAAFFVILHRKKVGIIYIARKQKVQPHPT